MKESEINVCERFVHSCEKPLFDNPSWRSPLPQGRAPVVYLGNATDDIRVFAGVVFLVATEYSNLAALQNVNLLGQKQALKDK